DGQERPVLVGRSARLRVRSGHGLGFMDLLGTFDDPDDQVAARTEIASLAPALAGAGGMLVLFCLCLAAAQAATGPWWLGSLTVTTTFIGLIAAVFNLGQKLGPWKLDELGLERPIWQRHGFWVLAIGSL